MFTKVWEDEKKTGYRIAFLLVKTFLKVTIIFFWCWLFRHASLSMFLKYTARWQMEKPFETLILDIPLACSKSSLDYETSSPVIVALTVLLTSTLLAASIFIISYPLNTSLAALVVKWILNSSIPAPCTTLLTSVNPTYSGCSSHHSTMAVVFTHWGRIFWKKQQQ